MSTNRVRMKWKPKTKRGFKGSGGGRVRTIMMNTAERDAMLFEAEQRRQALRNIGRPGLGGDE